MLKNSYIEDDSLFLNIIFRNTKISKTNWIKWAQPSLEICRNGLFWLFLLFFLLKFIDDNNHCHSFSDPKRLYGLIVIEYFSFIYNFNFFWWSLSLCLDYSFDFCNRRCRLDLDLYLPVFGRKFKIDFKPILGLHDCKNE